MPTTRRTLLRLAVLGAAAAGSGATVQVARAESARGQLVQLDPIFGNDQFPEESDGTYLGPNLHEASGIVASRRYPGVFWIIRDGIQTDDPVIKGYRNAVFAVRFNPDTGALQRWGSLVEQTSCDRYVKAVYLERQDGSALVNDDVEDVALEMAATTGPSWLWLGNIGNNPLTAKTRELFRVPEPDPWRDTSARIDLNYHYWSHPNHHQGQANVESIFIWEGVPHIVVKATPDGVGLEEGSVVKIPLTSADGTVDGIALGVLARPDSTGFKPTGADLRDGRLLVSRGTSWARYDADPSLGGDELIKALCGPQPAAQGYWKPDQSQASNEAIAWIHPSRSGSFLAVSETGVFRWWTGA